MVASKEEFRALLQEICGPAAQSVALDKTAESAVFLEGELRGFSGEEVNNSLTVSALNELMKALAMKTTIGDPEGRTCYYNQRYNILLNGCEIYIGSYCCPYVGQNGWRALMSALLSRHRPGIQLVVHNPLA